MLREISMVNDFRIFQSWRNDPASKPFKRVNLVYGTNGSGKSTFASLLQQCGSEAAFSPGLSGIAEDPNGVSIPITEGSMWLWRKVRVFNRQYVALSMRLEHEDGPSPDTLLTLGPENVKAQEELEAAKRRHQDLEESIRRRKSAIGSSTRALDDIYLTTARLIVQELGALDRYRSNGKYHKGTVREHLAQDIAPVSIDPASDLQVVALPRQQSVAVVPRTPIDNNNELSAVRRLLETHVVSTALSELSDDHRASWVQKGIELHVDLEQCLFCGQTLTVERRHALEAHFDEAIRRLQEELDHAAKRLENSALIAERYLDSVARHNDVYPDLAQEVLGLRSRYQREAAKFRKSVDTLIQLINSKRANPFQVVSLPSDCSYDVPDTSGLDAILDTHNKRCLSHDNDQLAAALRVENLRLSEVQSKAAKFATAQSTETRLAEEERIELQVVSLQIVELERADANPIPGALELTRDVARLLGRSELTFELAGDGHRYRIERMGQPALFLSEGESTAISLLHFLASLRTGRTGEANPIVVIDDPVSSLDQDVLFGASAHIWAELVSVTTATQVFLLTHSFELFRQWLIQLETARNHILGGFTANVLHAYEGPQGRRPAFEPWTTDKHESARLRSQYHYLFAKVGKTVLEASQPSLPIHVRVDLLALAPNAARRMLEAFLTFTFPKDIGNFHNGMRSAMSLLGSDTVRLRVERYLHAYSHNEEGDIGRPLEVSEGVQVLASVFYLINRVNPAHYEAMCSSLDIDGHAILRAAAD